MGSRREAKNTSAIFITLRGCEREEGRSLGESHGLNALPQNDWDGRYRTRLEECKESREDRLDFLPFPNIE